MKKFTISYSIFFALLLVSKFVYAEKFKDYFFQDSKALGPLNSRNQAPLLNLFYLMPVTNANTPEKGTFEFRLQFELSNILEKGISATNSVDYDMEIYRTSFHFIFALLDNLEIHMEIPTLSFDNGFLDGFLRGYHDFFNLPDGGRSMFPDDQFAYKVTSGPTTLINYPVLGFDLGDINFDVKWRIFEEKGYWPSLAVRTGIKLPTGNFEKGSGSGGWDFGLGFVLSKSIKRFNAFIGFDANIIEDPDPLDSFIVDNIFHWYFGWEFAFWKDQMALVVQFDGQTTPFVTTGLEQFDNDVFEIVFGVKGSHFKDRLQWEIGLREDLIPHSTVDFTFLSSIGTKF